jgi:hypothetical protein
MKWKFEEEFRLDKPETIGETDRHFDLDNYKDWLEYQLAEARKQLSLFAVSNNEVAVCRSYGSCYRPEKMKHDKYCGKHCEFYKAN